MRIDHKDVQIAYNNGGAEAVAAFIEEGTVSQHTLRRALHALEDAAVDTAELVTLLKEKKLMPTGARGQPDVGDARDYKVQNLDHRLVIILPVGHLDVTPEDYVRARFFVDDIRVARKEGD